MNDRRPVNLAETYNARLAFDGSQLRWRYRNPSDLNSDLYLESLLKPINKLQQEMELEFKYRSAAEVL